MKSSLFALFLLALALSSVAATAVNAAETSDGNWANWRGPHYNGTSTNAKPPVKWSEEENVRWKVPISGKGSSSPIIWGDKLFVLTAVPVPTEGAEAESPEGEAAPEQTPPPRDSSTERPRRGPGDSPGGPGGRSRGGRGRGGRDRDAAPTTPLAFTVICLDKLTGEKIWSDVAVQETPHESGHNTNTFASASAVTNGEILVAFFGSRGIFCYAMNGKLLWKRDLGKQQTRNAFGEGSTPALYKNSIIIPWDHEGDSFVLALDATTGEELWKVDRDEATSWATPVVAEHNGAAQVILNGSTRVRSYDVTSGKLLWECGGQATNPIATPIIDNGKAICMTGYRGYAVYAIDLDATGDVTDNDDYIAWSRSDVGPYISSATLLNNRLYVTKSRDGVLYCLDASTGETIYGPERLPEASTLYSSLVGADGKVYVSDRDGTTVVLQDGPEFKVLAVNQLAEGIDASIAFSGDLMFLRSEGHLYCMQQTK
ncbi:outer membrane protein assembly factor BamB family protein [Bremerella alba]|uniref:Outer membrane protein assembly factor BamB n=1 Tax=Bremerella alba TaxID=980252 RepID=A0A7V8V5J3_9BACT|nr:PQQ-binding-like beta-propeller repeat protein [Bremerella alba]MBA2115369.1 Outer membrane protein assembly factor BamB [Bremerella alba]